MAAPKIRTRPSFRFRKKSYVASLEFPRWIVATGVLIIAFMLLVGSLTDAQGNLGNPRLDAAAWLAAVACIEGYLIYSARNGKRAKAAEIEGRSARDDQGSDARARHH